MWRHPARRADQRPSSLRFCAMAENSTPHKYLLPIRRDLCGGPRETVGPTVISLNGLLSNAYAENILICSREVHGSRDTLKPDDTPSWVCMSWTFSVHNLCSFMQACAIFSGKLMICSRLGYQWRSVWSVVKNLFASYFSCPIVLSSTFPSPPHYIWTSLSRVGFRPIIQYFIFLVCCRVTYG